MLRRKSPLLAAWLTLALAACPDEPAAVTFPCGTHDDCAPGNECVDDVCRVRGVARDAGLLVRDAGQSDRDAGTRVDAGGLAGAGAMQDAGADAGRPLDGGSAVDGGGGADAGGTTDGGLDDGGVDPGDDGGRDAGYDAGPVLPEPVHHWPFDDAPGSTSVADVVGGAHGTVFGSATSGSGTLALNGSGDYVDLPNGIVSALDNATFEAWLRWDGPFDDDWARIFDFGTNSSGEVTGPGGGFDAANDSYLFLAATNSITDETRFVITVDGNGSGEEKVVDATRIPSNGSLVHVVVVYDADANLERLYTGGVLRDTASTFINLDEIVDHNNWLGRSNWSADPYFDGVFEDFRIYDVALTTEEVQARYAAGVP